ncbi:MAG: hypothetical protein KU38_07155 [Sulfurovum sp. FS08-3]|nr:MAG: hypothetical protein KU38_07155 [Sulfurovum sp. FS08-3]
MSKEYVQLFATLGAIFALLLIGAFFSPSFEEQRSFWVMLFNSTVIALAFALLVVVASIGFASFALYGAVMSAVVLVMFGVEGVLLMIGVTYAIWGFIFGFEALLVAHKVTSAQEWFKQRYTFESFYREYLAFYPIIRVLYIVIEVFPTLLDLQKPKRFEADEIVKTMRSILN